LEIRQKLITQLVHGDDFDLGVQERITQGDAADTTWLFSDVNDGDSGLHDDGAIGISRV
jgi:hypothetical protein